MTITETNKPSVDDSSHHTLLPGLDMVGRGVYLRPQQPFELRRLLFHRDTWQLYHSKETSETYQIPEGYEVNENNEVNEGNEGHECN